MIQETQPSTSRPSLPALRAYALALVAAAAALGGCGLIKINGKPLGGGDARASSPPRSWDSEEEASEPETSELGRRDQLGRSTAPDEEAGCKGAHQDERGTLKELEARLVDRGFEDIARDFVNAMCTRGGEYAKRRKEVLAMRAAWMERYQLDERDFAYLYRYSKREAGWMTQELTDFPGPVAEYAFIYTEARDRFLELDRLGVDASALARVALLQSCFSLYSKRYTKLQDYPLMAAILCSREPLSLTRAFQEIDAEPEMDDSVRYVLRSTAAKAADALERAREELAALAKEEPAVAELLQIADEEFQKWASPAPMRTKLVAQLVAMEAATRAGKRSGFAGCEQKTLASWDDVAGAARLPPLAAKVAPSDYAHATLSGDEGSLAYSALRLCAAAGDTRGDDDALAKLPSPWVRRGPRTATLSDWMHTDVEFDQRGLSLPHLLSSVVRESNVYFPDVVAGIVASVKETEGFATIEFKSVKENRIDCVNYRRTNRVRSVSSAGYVEYEEVCAGKGKVVVDRTPSALRVRKALAHGVKPGMYLWASRGLPVVASSSRSSKTPVFVLGAALR